MVDQKKRQTLERAKASHLSRQLQTRLQYAKLKVEHGWQRQNLNEVENLYFHHTLRRRSPSPARSASPPATTPPPAARLDLARPAQPAASRQSTSTLRPSTPPPPPGASPASPPPAPAPPPPTSTPPIASTALTYDSFWSTHASSTGPSRALYRTYAGFATTAAPGGNVAMLTPGGHAAVMTAEGVYVGRSG